MEMTETERWLPKPGELLEFEPTARSRTAAEQTPPVPTPASFMQESHIRGWARERDSDSAADTATEITMTCVMTMPLDRAALQQAFTAFVQQHDAVRCWFELEDAPEGALRRRLVDADDVEFTMTSLGRFESGDDIRELLIPRFKNLRPLQWPGFFCGAIDHGEDGFTLVYSIDHTHSDAMSLAVAVFELHTLYQSFVNKVQPAILEAGSHIALSGAERMTVAELELNSPAVQHLLTVLRNDAARIPSLPIEIDLGPGETAPSAGIAIDLLDAAECDAFAAVCKAAGGSFSAGIYAALALTELTLAGHRHYLGLNVVTTRLEPQYLLAQGWFVNLVPVSFEVGDSVPFTEIVARSNAALTRAKSHASVPLLGVHRDGATPHR